MNLTNLKKAPDYEVKDWIEKNIRELTPYQKQKMFDDEMVRWAPFEFYKSRNDKKSSPLWRLTIFFLPFYFLLIVLGLPIKFMITGTWGYNQRFLDKYYHPWLRKLNI